MSIYDRFRAFCKKFKPEDYRPLTIPVDVELDVGGYEQWLRRQELVNLDDMGIQISEGEVP